MTQSAAPSPGCLRVDAIADADIAAVVALWERCGLTRPWNEPRADIARARGKTNSEVLVGRDGAAIVATVMVGHDGHRGSFYYVAVDPDQQMKGHGRAIVTAGEDWLHQRGIEKLQLMVRPGNTAAGAFYETLDFGKQERVIYAKWLDGRAMTP